VQRHLCRQVLVCFELAIARDRLKRKPKLIRDMLTRHR
jgi:hypothetical protein